MLRKFRPGLGRANVMVNSFASRVSDAPEEFSRTPEMSFCKIISKPRVFLHEFKCAVPFEQLECFADRHCWRQFNEKMDMVNSDVNFINFTSVFNCNFMDKFFAINSNSEKFERIHCIFGLPHEVESILPEGMAERLKIHFFAPELVTRNIAHANSTFNFIEGNICPHYFNDIQELNINEDGSPPKLKSEGIRAIFM